MTRVSRQEIEIVLREGRNRQVRRMVEAVGNRVVSLKRIAFGPLRLGRLASGGARRLTAKEIDGLRGAAGATEPPESDTPTH